MGQNAHTPWKVIPRDETPGHREPVMVDTGTGLWEPRSDRRAEFHAELMVRAANCHDELLAALKWFIDDIDGTHTVMLDFDANVKRARAALAKAQPASEGE